MKFTVEVNLDDFFSDEDNASFSEQIKDDICNKVTQRIYIDWGNRIDHEITGKIQQVITVQKDKVIDELITNAITKNKIKKSRFSSEMITIEEAIQQELKDTYNIDLGFHKSVINKLNEKSKEYITELQKRYDIAFATQIIIKLNENKMLKDDVASLLLSDAN